MTNPPMRSRLSPRSGEGSLATIIGSAVLILVCIAGYFGVDYYLKVRRQRQFAEKTLKNYSRAKKPLQKIHALQPYLDEYPDGPFASEMKQKQLLAKRECGVNLHLDLTAQLNGGDLASLEGRLLLLRCELTLEELIAKAEQRSNVRITDPYDDNALSLFDAIGEATAVASPVMVSQAELQEGSVRFSHIPFGRYIVYGAASAGHNLIGIVDELLVDDSTDQLLTPRLFLGYTPEAKLKASAWSTRYVRQPEPDSDRKSR